MKVHHLNCGTMRPPGSAPLVCHVLLVETDSDLVLVDTGYGLADVADPRRIGPIRHVLKPAFAAEETAARQVERLGHSKADVRHIVITHFDLDHIGGLADFPDAQIHVTSAEVQGAITAPSWRERVRYRPIQWAHGPTIVEHGPGGESWRGFPAAKELSAISAGIVLVPLPGHTRGHAGVAVDAGDRWILHCGDAFYSYGSIDGRTPVPIGLRVQEKISTYNRKQLSDNRARLGELYLRAEPDLLMICSHDTDAFASTQRR